MPSVQNLRFRHPRLWEAVVVEHTMRFWQAREIATQCHTAKLTRAQAKWVDQEVTGYVESLPWGRGPTPLRRDTGCPTPPENHFKTLVRD